MAARFGGVALPKSPEPSAARPDAGLLARLLAVPTWLQALVGVLVVVFYAERIWMVYRDTGLFRRIGFDWGLFYAQPLALASGDVPAMYHLDRVNPYLQRLVT